MKPERSFPRAEDSDSGYYAKLLDIRPWDPTSRSPKCPVS